MQKIRTGGNMASKNENIKELLVKIEEGTKLVFDSDGWYRRKSAWQSYQLFSGQFYCTNNSRKSRH